MFQSIKAFFTNILFPKVKAFLSKALNSAVQIAIAEIQDTVKSVVKELSYENITNSEKRTEAYRRVVAELKASGKEIKESVIRTTIELAVLELKATVGEK